MHKKTIETTELLDVAQAAGFLGVHTATIRRWAYNQQLKGLKVGIRGDWRFSREELLKMARANVEDNSDYNSELMLAPKIDLHQVQNRSHFVQFYENDAKLVDSIYNYVKPIDAAIVIATYKHREELEKVMLLTDKKRELKKKYIFLDAEETLSKFMIGNEPNPTLFDQVVGELIRKTLKKYKYVRAYGEMVALLWARGNKTGAIKLEKLWNKLQKRYTFTLYCAYPMRELGGDGSLAAFREICSSHNHVIPAESYSELNSLDDRMREISILQQKSQSLEAEIEKRKEAEKTLIEALLKLKASEQFNRNIVESSTDCIKVMDYETRLLSMNGPGCNILELDNVNKVIGESWLSFWKGKYNTLAREAVAAAKQGKTGRFQGFCPTFKGAPKWWDVVVSPILDENNKVDKLVAVSRDITELKEIEIRKDDFISVASHELKTPLTSQKGYVQILSRLFEKNNDIKYRKFATKIEEQTNKLTKLVFDLLDSSKIQNGKLVLNQKLTDINKVVYDAVEEARLLASNLKIEIEGSISQEITVDSERITQVLNNFLTNAIKYSPRGKKIKVEIKGEKKRVVISVTDFGIGIDKKDQHKLFERFYRVSGKDESTFPGLGLGLFISKEIINRHKGEIWVVSTKGKGSTFSFSLPLS